MELHQAWSYEEAHPQIAIKSDLFWDALYFRVFLSSLGCYTAAPSVIFQLTPLALDLALALWVLLLLSSVVVELSLF